MEKIKDAIDRRKLTKLEAARQIGITRQTLYNILSGQQMDVATARKIERWSNGEIRAAELMGV